MIHVRTQLIPIPKTDQWANIIHFKDINGFISTYQSDAYATKRIARVAAKKKRIEILNQ